MKRITIYAFASLFAVIALFAQPTKNVEVKYTGYTLSSSVGLTGKITGDVVPVFSGTLDSLTKKKTQVQFGFLFRENTKNLSKVVAAELFDGANKSLRKITLEELLGKENAGWKVSEQISGMNAAVTYQFSAGGKEFKLYRTISATVNKNIVTGRMISEQYGIECNDNAAVRLKIYGRAEGTVVGEGQIVRMTSNDAGLVFAPSIILSYSGNTQVELTKNTKKGMPVLFTAISEELALTANQKAEILNASIFGTSVAVNNQSVKQANNIQNYLVSKRTVPELAAITTTDRNAVTPGDTMTYTIIYHNIGSAAAADITISNPIPANTVYVENSASGSGSTISVEREKVTLPKVGAVKSVSWNFKEAIYPGEERSAKFKVILQ
jgi:uncharacterized repeat protein (TIGR01451 family)